MKKNYKFWRFYTIVGGLLALALAYPMYQTISLARHTTILFRSYPNVTAMVPFLGVFVAILIGFLCLPLVSKLPRNKVILGLCGIALPAFIATNLYAERLVTALNLNIVLMSRRMALAPGEIIPLDLYRIPWVVRFHYYIFAIIFVLAVLNFLYSLASLWYGEGKPEGKVLAVYGISTACYGLAFFFVRVMEYHYVETRHITRGSVVNTVLCFMFAAIALGLFSANYVKPRWIAPGLSVLVVVALYIGQYFMLDGGLYLYSYIQGMTMAIRVLVALVPGVVVYGLIKFLKI